jgi:hypothetical protein
VLNAYSERLCVVQASSRRKRVEFGKPEHIGTLITLIVSRRVRREVWFGWLLSHNAQ